MPHISIVIPTYTRAYSLPRVLASVQAQTLTDWECLIIDDGSTDDTESVVGAMGDPRCIFHRQENQGPAVARNTGRDLACGEIVVYLDSDDTFRSEALATIASTLVANGGDYGIIAHTRLQRLVDDKGVVLAEKNDPSGRHEHVTPKDIYDWKIKTTSSGTFHRNIDKYRAATWQPGIWVEDLDFLMRLLTVDADKFVYIPQVLVDYVQTYGQDGLCSKATYGTYAHAFGTIYELHKNDPLMTSPDVYLSRVAKYRQLDEQERRGEIMPQMYKYFPEFWQSGLRAAS